MPRTPLPTGTETPRKHGVGGWRSLFISTLVLLGVVLLWKSLSPTVGQVERRPVDVAASASYVAQETGWPIRVPQLGEEWRPTSVRFDAQGGARTWEIGYVRDDDPSVFVSVAQSGEVGSGDAANAWVREFTRGGGETGPVQVNGETWTGYTAQEKNPRHALVPQLQGQVATVVSGLGDPANLAAVAGSLQPVNTGR